MFIPFLNNIMYLNNKLLIIDFLTKPEINVLD